MKVPKQKSSSEKAQNQHAKKAENPDFQAANQPYEDAGSLPDHILNLQGVIGNQAVQRLLKQNGTDPNTSKIPLLGKSRLQAKKAARLDEENQSDGMQVSPAEAHLQPKPIITAQVGDVLSRETPEGPPSSINLPNIPAESIPKTWRTSPVPPSGGADVYIYRGLERGAAKASAQIIRAQDVASGGFTSTDLKASQDAVFNQYGRDPVLSGPDAGGVVRVKVPAAVWDQLAKTNNISQRSYGGFATGMNTSELRINSDAAAKVINGLPNDVIPPDPFYDHRPGARRSFAPAPVPSFGGSAAKSNEAPATQTGGETARSNRSTAPMPAVKPQPSAATSETTGKTTTQSGAGAEPAVTPSVPSSSTGGTTSKTTTASGAPPAPAVTPSAPPTYGPGTRMVAGGLSLLVVANEILGPIARVRNVQQHNIDVGNAQIDFWKRFGANPKMGIWDQRERRQLPEGTTPTTSVWGGASFPYVVDIDVNALKANLPRLITDYQSFVHFLATGKELETLVEDPVMPVTPTRIQKAEKRRYYINVNIEDRANRRRYDVTDIILQIQSTVLNQVDSSMRSQMKGLSAAQQGHVFRLKHGSETPVYRSARGRQPILSSQQFFGPDPWVRPTGKQLETSWWQSFQRRQTDDRLLVVPANGDAERSSLVSAYWVQQPIEDVFDEVRDGKREIKDRQPRDGKILNSFVAGPEPGDNSRFGDTRYYRHYDPDVRWTVAIGELRQFWIDASELEAVPQAEIANYLK